MSKLKLTGFGRLVLFLIIIGPIVYFGLQYLQKNGTLDKIKEKVETPKSDRDQESASGDRDILQEIDRNGQSQAELDREAIIAEQRRKIEELKRQNQELQKQKESSTSSIPDITIPEPSISTTDDGAPSLDDLIAQAEKGVGRSSNTDDVDVSSSRKSLASWTFTFSGVNGLIEFYEQNNRLMSRATYQGMDRVDVFELDRRGDRFYVKGSPTDEYYELRSDGNLDAYDRSGFQTTCKRR